MPGRELGSFSQKTFSDLKFLALNILISLNVSTICLCYVSTSCNLILISSGKHRIGERGHIWNQRLNFRFCSNIGASDSIIIEMISWWTQKLKFIELGKFNSISIWKQLTHLIYWDFQSGENWHQQTTFYAKDILYKL